MCPTFLSSMDSIICQAAPITWEAYVKHVPRSNKQTESAWRNWLCTWKDRGEKSSSWSVTRKLSTMQILYCAILQGNRAVQSIIYWLFLWDMNSTTQTLSSNLSLFNSTGRNQTDDGVVTIASQTEEKLSLRSIAYILIGSFGCCGNMLCLIVFLASRRLRSKGVHVFLLNQTVADLYCCLVLVATYDDMVRIFGC